jgi:hypothetical protein
VAATSGLETHAPAGTGRRRAQPVLLATLGVPLEPDASTFAVDAAVESAAPLIIANVVELPPLAMSVNMRYDQLEDEADLAAALRFPAALAHSLGVQVERIRVKSPRPIEALVELVSERCPSLLVFGPDRGKLRPRVYRRAARALRERASCLLWLQD